MSQEAHTDIAQQAALVTSLLHRAAFPHPAHALEHLETHISHIVLAGNFAYKLKKPLNLGFLDFTSLERRRYYCEQELRLNRRLAPDLYLDCIAICGSAEKPIIGGDPNAAIEYAVKMVRFPQESLLDKQLAAGNILPTHMEALGRELAEFHQRAATATTTCPFGSFELIQQQWLDGYSELQSTLTRPADLQRIEALHEWFAARAERLHNVTSVRKCSGFIRECHGDLHLGNMILRDENVAVFDCIEFSDALRWIDVISDLAFLIMDLYQRGAAALASTVLNSYMETAGDYDGMAVLRYYVIYRAMVRAKIAAIRMRQLAPKSSEFHDAYRQCASYVTRATRLMEPNTPFLAITHGVSGSGKTYITSQLLRLLGAVRIRSDVERKRLFELAPMATSRSALGQGLYTPEASTRTYARLRELATHLLGDGYPVIVDAAFLEQSQRRAFQDLAQRQRVPFVLLACGGPEEVLRERVARRSHCSNDASEADVEVLNRQLRDYLPPGDEEMPLEAGHRNIGELHAAIVSRIKSPLTS